MFHQLLYYLRTEDLREMTAIILSCFVDECEAGGSMMQSRHGVGHHAALLLCIRNEYGSRQIKFNTLKIKQHLQEVIKSPLSGNVLVNEINNNSNKTLVMRDASKGEIKKSGQDAGDAQPKLISPTETIRQHLKDEVISSLSGNIFRNAQGEQAAKDTQADVNIMVKTEVPELFQTKASAVKINEHFKRQIMTQFCKNIVMSTRSEHRTSTPIKGGNCGKETKMKFQECEIILSPPDDLKGFKCANTGKNKQNFNKNAVPTISGKISVAMQVRFQVTTNMDDRSNDCKINLKCNQLVNSFNIPKISPSSVSPCNKPIPCNSPWKPKAK